MSFSKSPRESGSWTESQDIEKMIAYYKKSLEYYRTLNVKGIARHPEFILQMRQSIGQEMKKMEERLSQNITDAKKNLDDIMSDRQNAMSENEVLAIQKLGIAVFGELLLKVEATRGSGTIDEDLERTRLSVNPEEAGLNALQNHMRKISMALAETLGSLVQKAAKSGRPVDQATLAVVIFNGLSQQIQKIVDEKKGARHEDAPIDPRTPKEMMAPLSQPGRNPLDQAREWKWADLNLHLPPEKTGDSSNGSK